MKLKIKPSQWLGSFSFESKFSTPLLVAAVSLLGFALRLVRLDFQPLWWDEGWSLFFATRDFGTMLERTAVDIHPPLYYALLTMWMQFAGKGQVALRLLSVVVGVATIPLLYALGRRLFGSRVALVSALLIAVAPLHIYYSQEVRMYGLVTLFGLASVYLFVELLWQPPSRSTSSQLPLWLLYVVITAAALYTQYYAAFVVAFQVIVVLSVVMAGPGQPHSQQPTSPLAPLLQGEGNPELPFPLGRRSPTLAPHTCPRLQAPRGGFVLSRGASAGERSGGEKGPGVWLARWVAAWLAIAALYLPWALYAGPKLYAYVTMKVTHEAYTPIDPVTYLAQHLAAFSVGHISVWTWLVPSSFAVVLLLLVGMFFAQTGDRTPMAPSSPRLIAILYLVVPLVLGYLVNLVYPFAPMHGERLLLPAAPAFYLLASLGILALWDRRRLAGLVALVFIASICTASLYDFYTVPRYPNDDYRPAIANIQRLAQPSDAYLAVHPWQIGYLAAYYDGAPLAVVETPSADWIGDPSKLERGMGTILAAHPRSWLPAFQTLGRVLEDAMEGYLRPRTYTVLDTWFGTTKLELFANAPEPTYANRSIALKQNLTLKDYAVSPGPVAAGQDILPIKLNWSDSVPTGYSESLRLVDAQGYAWAQDDRGIEKGEQRIGFAIPDGTPPGEYELKLIAYREQAGNVQDAVSLSKVNVTSPSRPNIASLPNRLLLSIGDGIQLVGYDAGENPLRPGDAATITLFWQAQRALNTDYSVMLQVVDDRGNVYAGAESAPARGMYPTSRWQLNEIVRDPQSITLRGDTPDGNLNLLVGLYRANPQSIVVQRIAGAITVKGRPHYFAAPQVSVRSDTRFGDLARLSGYDMDQEKGSLHLILHWQALGPTSSSFKVFAHILDSGGNIINQGDQVPGGGAFPTTSWVKGEYLMDEYNISLPSTQAAQIAIGMYDIVSGARLPAFNGSNQPLGDRILLPVRID
jgi:4-amino-4-deoxy-L-arabinose transferase-like glycosyltransferase